jgi:hypothetical protein
MAIQLLRGTTAQIANNTNKSIAGQPLYDIDKHILYIGDGETAINELEGTNIGLNIENGTGSHSIEHILSIDGTRYNRAEGAYSVALGQQGIAYGRGSISVGNSTQAGVKDLAEWKSLPNKETATQDDMNKYNRYQFVIGASNKALGGHSFAGGGFSIATGLESFAFGYEAKASNDYSISLGYQTLANGLRSIALGTKSIASGENAIAIGYGSEAHGDDAIAIGWNSPYYSNKVTGTKSLAIGIGNTVESDNVISIGYHNRIAGEKKNIFQLGYNLSSEYENTIALGHYNKDRYVDNVNKGILLSVGNGTASARSNAFEVLRDGRAKVQSQPVEENDVLRWQEKVELENRIEGEEHERQSADDNLQSAIEDEKNARQSADARLETLVQNAVSAQEERDAQLQNLLDDEVQRATSTESALTENITNEVTRATAKESQLDSIIEAETTRATEEEILIKTDLANKTANGYKYIQQCLVANSYLGLSDAVLASSVEFTAAYSSESASIRLYYIEVLNGYNSIDVTYGTETKTLNDLKPYEVFKVECRDTISTPGGPGQIISYASIILSRLTETGEYVVEADYSPVVSDDIKLTITDMNANNNIKYRNTAFSTIVVQS